MISTVSDGIEEVLRHHGWVQADLARVLAWNQQTVSEVMQRKRRIDAQLAVDLEEVSQRSAASWLALQAEEDIDEIRRSSANQERAERIKLRAQIEDLVPTRELKRRKVLSSSDAEQQAREVCELLGVATLDELPPFEKTVAAKRSATGRPFTRQQRAWVALAERQARSKKVANYSQAEFKQYAAHLPRAIDDPAKLADLPRHFAELGVALVHVEPLPGGSIDGASWRCDDHPAIAISGRGKRFDKVFFALMHECAHVVLGHWQPADMQVHEGGQLSPTNPIGSPDVEAQVNELAQSWVFPAGVGQHSPASKHEIAALAATNGIHESLVIGNLQFRELLPWSSWLGRGIPSAQEAIANW